MLKEEILNLSNSVIMASMYSTLATTEHQNLNPHQQADFDPSYLTKILSYVLLVDTDEKAAEFINNENQELEFAQAKYKNNADELTKRIGIINQMYGVKNKRLNELKNLQDKFYIILENYSNLLNETGEVYIELDTDSYYDYLRFNANEAIVCEYLTIYNKLLKAKVDDVKSQLKTYLDEQNLKDE